LRGLADQVVPADRGLALRAAQDSSGRAGDLVAAHHAVGRAIARLLVDAVLVGVGVAQRAGNLGAGPRDGGRLPRRQADGEGQQWALRSRSAQSASSIRYSAYAYGSTAARFISALDSPRRIAYLSFVQGCS